MPPSFRIDVRNPAQIGGLRAAFDGAWHRMHQVGADDDILALFFDLAAWRPWLDEALRLLDGAEQERVQRRQRVRDREDLALAYALHRLVLGGVLQRDAAQVVLSRDTLGRPWLPGDQLQTSLSHADGFAAVAVGGRGPVGIDLELARRAADMHEIAERVCHPSEARALAELPQAQRAQALLALWVRKEALLKAAGIGLARAMESFEAPTDRVLPLPVADGGEAIIRMLDIGPAWVAAVAGRAGVSVRAGWLHPQT